MNTSAICTDNNYWYTWNVSGADQVITGIQIDPDAQCCTACPTLQKG